MSESNEQMASILHRWGLKHGPKHKSKPFLTMATDPAKPDASPVLFLHGESPEHSKPFYSVEALCEYAESTL